MQHTFLVKGKGGWGSYDAIQVAEYRFAEFRSMFHAKSNSRYTGASRSSYVEQDLKASNPVSAFRKKAACAKITNKIIFWTNPRHISRY
jgi:hypothetical protein